MHEQRKLQEAGYFLERMRATLQEPETFQYNLSAFLSAARSVAQYARKEASTRPGGHGWCDRFVAHHPLIGFFASQRNANIHERPVELGGHVEVYVADQLSVGDAATVGKFDVEGNLVEVVTTPPSEPADHPPPQEFRFVLHYRFAEWNGDDEVVELSSRYLDSLRALVQDGQARGFISSLPPRGAR